MSGAVVGIRREDLGRIAADRRHLFAAQVRRVASGYTEGRLVEGQAVLPCLSPRGPAFSHATASRAGSAAPRERAAPKAPHVPLPDRLAALLLPALLAWPDDEPLPAPRGLLALLEWHRDGDVFGALARAYDVLQADGHIRTIAGGRGQYHGERAIRLLATGRILATAGCPPHFRHEVAHR